MNSCVNKDFVACFQQLPDEIKELARKNYKLWKTDPYYPSLSFKRISAAEPVYSVRIGLGWRALGLLEDGEMTWFWIGSHADYDKLLGQL